MINIQFSNSTQNYKVLVYKLESGKATSGDSLYQILLTHFNIIMSKNKIGDFIFINPFMKIAIQTFPVFIPQ